MSQTITTDGEKRKTRTKKMGLVRVLISLVVAIAMGWGGYKKRSLNFSGSIAAVFVGSIVMLASIRCGVVLIAFFVTSSLVTKVGKVCK